MKADKASVSRYIKTARGQLDGILQMIENDRYCVDIATQLMASQSLLAKAEKEILIAHINACVRGAAQGEDGDQKIDEMLKILDKLIK